VKTEENDAWKESVIINLGVVQAPQRQLVLLCLEHHLFADLLDQRQRGSKVLQLFRPHAGLKVHRLVATAATAAATAAGHHPKCFLKPRRRRFHSAIGTAKEG
jgi:hypothetical protein